MARLKEFDPDVALERAMELFWRQGYAATSVADLVAHLGVARASLYATFGNKHDLYVAALERYMGRGDPNLVEVLATPGPVLPVIGAVLRAAAAPTPQGLPPGCMVVNAAAECPPEDVVVRRRLELNWAAIEVALTSALLRARAQGEVRADTDAVSTARFLLVLMQGIPVVIGPANDPDGLKRADAAVRHAVGMLDALR
ncbi:MAG TPA: TetR family transcriptional regulator [Pseudonocardia sp.]|nr:TetR family transcriptional regulator [Pseudonocardia sp.]